MKNKKLIGKNIGALLLFVALMTPSVIQFFHMLEGHEYTSCTQEVTHIHQSIAKCEICSFHFTPINYDIVEYPDLLLPRIYVKVDETFTPLHFHSFKINNKQLRAPPLFS